MCECKVGPGKFEGEDVVAFLAYQQMLNGCVDSTTGPESGETDWFRAPLNFDADAGVVDAALAYGYCQECIESHNDIRGGVSLWESNQGFVYCTTYDTREEYDRALSEAETEDATDAAQDDASE